ncbi:hypothetical protein M8756_17660 [Lutimaribacter sp. EGI FJ00015]|uniref:Uncharacterized protein n=1 Tax=Lutimaribacter degradans TaxID=2945989 RepID=A0ACC6A0N4_9RHOB|nr:hypothetical protein [Lutimaribacter sp. EGI FJ00013]MCM2563925.1 hypothetical protein [Lutimaribacter sp. EGI FJ00013]MCO0615137.1 hypothetical protein [Lutimaribacter sp. EGI FJ00015]MCO0637762.1 hypothetical protein [Lutimaribacter sp. EGI FJ00014]
MSDFAGLKAAPKLEPSQQRRGDDGGQPKPARTVAEIFAELEAERKI